MVDLCLSCLSKHSMDVIGLSCTVIASVFIGWLCVRAARRDGSL